MIQRVTVVDEKNLMPSDKVWADYPQADITKPEIGRVQITNLKTGEITKVNNLVLLEGREILLQKLLGLENGTNFNIRYFRVGSGGCTVGTTPSKIGPYDDDTDLYEPVLFTSGNDLDNGTYKYIHGGKSKNIFATDLDGNQGSIEIINEQHTINTVESGNSVTKTVDKKTTVKFTMYVHPLECNPSTTYPSRVFRFNEAALLMTNMELENSNVPFGGTDNEKFNTDSKVFARFTTLNKYLEASDGLKIEWFILV
jgi:hypothetical protein